MTTLANGRIAFAITDQSGGSPALTSRIEVEYQAADQSWCPLRTVDGGGAIELPHVAAVGEFASAADATTHDLVLPAPVGGILADDLLIAFVAMDGNPTLTMPADWTEIKDEAGNGNAVRAGVFWKRANGGEIGTVTLTTSASEGGGARILCIRDAHPATAPEVSTGVSGSGANADPDSLNPAGWGAENTLWIAAVANDGNVAVTDDPGFYREFGNTRWANASGAGIATAHLLQRTTSEDPSAFTHTAEDTRAFTVAVRPRNTSLAAYDYEAPSGTARSYRARAVHDFLSGGAVASGWVLDSATWTPPSWWLKHPHRPDLNVAVTVRDDTSRTRSSRAGVFHPLGRSAPVVVRDSVRSKAAGTVTLRSLTIAEQDDLDALLDEQATLLLQSPQGHGGPDYIGVLSHDRRRIIERDSEAAMVWEVLDFVQVDPPPGDIVAWP